MKTRALTTVLGVVAAAALVLSGCSWTQRGAIAGGAAGTAIGAGWGYAASRTIDVAKLAVGGGAAGAAGGALVGDQFDQAKARNSGRELENLRAQLTERETELAQLRSGSSPQTQELEARIQALSAENQDLAAAAQEKAALEAELASLRQSNESAQSQVMQLSENNQRVNELEAECMALREQIAAREAQLNALQTTVQEKASAVENLRSKLADLNVELEETNRGLTLTILDQLLYQPGQASLTAEGKALLASVADIIQTQFPGREIIVEGHTDNQPIRYSKWASNWELGAARALAVVHVLTGEHGFDPQRISAMSFGEFRPAADNSSAEGRGLNRRSVIVILPEKVPFQKQVAAMSTP